MKVLLLGGTQFVGRHIVEAMLAGGHHVSILTRGKTPDELPAQVERLHGDRDEGVSGLQVLADRTWDACVDVSGYTPRQVRASVEALRTRVQRYVFVSAVRVYGEPSGGPVRETHPRMAPAGEDVSEVNDETYGALKVTCENIVNAAYGDRCTVLRPQVVAGAHDPVDRLSYWVRRAGTDGPMLAPGDGTDHLQFIDAHDAAGFTRKVVEDDLDGDFNLAGPRLTWAQFMTIMGAQNLVWVNADVIKAAALGIGELPLYRRDRAARSGLMHVSNERAVGAGLTLTSVEVTLGAIREWVTKSDLAPALSPAREAELIRMASATADR